MTNLCTWLGHMSFSTAELRLWNSLIAALWNDNIILSLFKRHLNNNNNNPICKVPECQKTSVALKTALFEYGCGAVWLLFLCTVYYINTVTYLQERWQCTAVRVMMICYHLQRTTPLRCLLMLSPSVLKVLQLQPATKVVQLRPAVKVFQVVDMSANVFFYLIPSHSQWFIPIPNPTFRA